MIEQDTEAAASKKQGWFRSAAIRATAVIGVVTTLVLASVALLEGVDKLVDKARQTYATVSRQTPANAPMPSAAAPQQPVQTPPARESAPPRREGERAAGTLFVVAPPGNDGALIGTRARKVLEQEGFALADDRGAASLAIEIGSPAFGPARTLPSSGLQITTVTAALRATIAPSAGAASVAPPQQREVVGRGDGEDEARRDAILRAADQLSERIAATLRESAASNGPKL